MSLRRISAKSKTKTTTDSIAEEDIMDPTFQRKLSKTRLDDTSDPMPLNAFKIGGFRHAPLPKNSSKTRH